MDFIAHHNASKTTWDIESACFVMLAHPLIQISLIFDASAVPKDFTEMLALLIDLADICTLSISTLGIFRLLTF
jgi:hypothetical protein